MDTVRDISEHVLDYSWRRGIEILQANGKSMDLSDFMSQLEAEMVKELGIEKLAYATDRIITPAYNVMCNQRVVSVRSFTNSNGRGSTITLLQDSEPDYKDEDEHERYLQYVAANLAKVNGRK